MKTPTPRAFQAEWNLAAGEALRIILESEGVRQSELADRTGFSPKYINQVIKGSGTITGDFAHVLERALGYSTEFWMSMVAHDRAHQARAAARRSLPDHLSWARNFNHEALQRHSVVAAGDDEATYVDKLLKHFRVADPDSFVRTWLEPRASFRRNQKFRIDTYDTALWLSLVERRAQGTEVEPYSPRALRHFARKVSALANMSVVDGYRTARSGLAEAGVALCFVREIPNTRIVGATWWLAADRPAIGITERHRRLDIFWFTLLHEIGHILLHGRRETHLDVEGGASDKPPMEEEADEFAESMLLSADAKRAIEAAHSETELLRIAAKFSIAPSIVAGQYGHLTGGWKVASKLRASMQEADLQTMEAVD